MQCGAYHQYDNSNNATFFANHPNLKWIETNYTQYLNVEGKLKVGYLYVGRINVTTTNGTYQVIGKIYLGFIYYRNPENTIEYVKGDGYEILACTQCSYTKPPSDPCCTNGAKNKYCCTNGANNEDCCLNGGSGEFCCTVSALKLLLIFS